MEKIAFNFTLLQSIIVSNLDFYLFFSAHPCTVISYCNVMFNGIKHIIPHIASILELISSENQCTFSYECLQTWSNATLWLHALDIHCQYISLESFDVSHFKMYIPDEGKRKIMWTRYSWFSILLYLEYVFLENKIHSNEKCHRNWFYCMPISLMM